MLDEVNSDLENDIDNLMNDSDTEIGLEETLENELDSDDEPINLLVPEANYHVVGNPTIEKTLEEGNSKADKEVKRKSKEKGKGKGKDKGKSKGKSREKEKKPSENKFDLGKNMLYMQRNNLV